MNTYIYQKFGFVMQVKEPGVGFGFFVLFNDLKQHVKDLWY